MNKNIEVAVIGAGLMGHGLALVHAMGGHKVKMQDISKEQLEAGVALIAGYEDGEFKSFTQIKNIWK